MKLQINTGTRIKDVQEKFSKAFPFLKIEFYSERYAENKVSAKKARISPDKILSTLSKIFKEESLDIGKNRTVAAVEKEFYEKFGIAMQVSRKSGNIWIETSKTDYRTLDVQNQLGKSMSSSHAPLIAEEEF